ncbi:tyrosine--tRNA ligase [Christensenellaceae bacterium]|nr:tyrosine--tRNA ligase [Christensenellaceae bacterium]BDF62238.1 tyrosine--tRNA ligase [Christensenellaceae bacterium]
MANVFDTLQERGFLKQTTHEGLKEMLGRDKVKFYVGFDATADSLHVGHFVQLMAMAHMQRAGHVPIVLIGGGTTMIGDPSGKSDMRKMMTREMIAHNADRFREQIGKFLDFSDGRALMVDNADWLLDLNYVEFLREIGTCFSVNRMLGAECYKQRLEKGLTFFEFNYMLMQAYDFLELNRKYGCTLEMGGDDQWSNILAGADLIRRKEQKEAYGLTITLLLKSDGKKMGKTESGAVWLDPEKTPPYDFYQYWRNVADADVKTCLSLLTFLPMDEVQRLSALKDHEINDAKKILAFEITKQVHGQAAAVEAQTAAEALFGGGGAGGSIPTTQISAAELAECPQLLDIMMKAGLTKSRGEGRRLITQGGVLLNGEKVTDEFASLSEADLADGGAMIKKGKKVFHKIVLK